MLSLLACAALAIPADAPALDGALLCDHPGLRTGHWEDARADWLAALEAEPRSALAADAARALESLPSDGMPPLDVARVLAIADGVSDAEASYVLRRVAQREVARRRFSDDPVAEPDDLFADFLTEWRVLGPLGSLDHNAPAWQAEVPDAPERELRATHRSAWGEDLTWTPLVRGRNQAYVRPADVVWPAGGVSYLLTFVRCESDVALLELRTRGEMRVWWNGREIADVRRAGPVFRDERFVVSVPVSSATDWNAVLLRVPGDETVGYAVRLLDRSRAALAFEERVATAAGFPSWAPARFEPQAVSARAELPGDAYAPHLIAQRHLRDRRPDRALAVAGPVSGPTRPAWLAIRYRALDESGHLPAEVERRSKLEILDELRELGAHFADLRQDEILRLLGEDQVEDALALVDESLRANPESGTFGVLRVLALRNLDRTGLLARHPLEALIADHPRFAAARYLLAQELEAAGDLAGAYDHARAALAANGSDEQIQSMLVRLAERRRDELLDLETRLRGWLQAEPLAGRASALLHRVLIARGDLIGALARARVRLSRAPRHPERLREVAVLTTALGLDAEARSALEATLARDPGDPSTRRSADALGVPDPAQRFFEEFGPDPAEARAAAVDARDASIAEALDSGMVYLYPDGSSHHRYHTITLALDRRGTELLHETPVQAYTRLAQVVKADGRVLEPVVVGGAWVMPSLDPGDSVEMIWDNHTPGKPGTAPDLGWWRFASFDKPFVRSRYVLYVPDGLPGELRTFHFEGTHEKHAWEGGTVHVFLAADMSREEREVWQPSFEELLPWLSYGGDRDLGFLADEWRAGLTSQTTLPAELEPELAAWIATTASGLEGVERARALHDGLMARLLDVQGGSRAAEVWLQKRGNPLFLLGAVYERAGVSFDWGVLERQISPELDPEPVRAFRGRVGYERPVLRLSPPDEEAAPLWVLAPPAKGFPFATIPDQVAGAGVLVFGQDGRERAELPRAQLADSWNLDMDIVLALDADGTGVARGTLRITSADGAVMREQIGQLGAEDRSRALRGLAQSVMPGITLEGLDMLVGEVGFQLGFRGRLPGLVKETGGEHRVGLMLQTQPQLSTGLGPADRRWPLALRVSQRMRQRMRIELGDAWTLVEQPEGFREERDGFEHSLDFEEQDGALLVTRTLVLRGLVVEAAEMPAFLQGAAAREREEMRPLRIEPRR